MLTIVDTTRLLPTFMFCYILRFTLLNCSFHLASVQRLGLQTVLLATRSSLRVT